MQLTNLNKTLSEIFEAKYIVPLYQRNFAWSDEEISQLLQDLYERFKKDKAGNYFIGSLVVLHRRNGDFEVIDGQQRLTVITLIAKVLNVDFSREPRLFYDSRPEVESFYASFYHTGKTNDVTFDYKVSHLVHAVDIIKESIINPDEKELKTILTIDNIAEFKTFFSNKVILVRVEIPEDTDVANYFEIMNNRGDQLKKHEILKAKLMDNIRDSAGYHNKYKQKVFSKIWDACSQMDIPIQKSFSKSERCKYFGEDYSNFAINGLGVISDDTNQTSEKDTNAFHIEDILNKPIEEILSNEQIHDIDDESDDKSIIDFPNFLMHILRIKYNTIYKEIKGSEVTESEIPLNEKDLLSVFYVLGEFIEPMEFVEAILYYRSIFDRYIIKASTDENAEDDYRWSLEKPYKYVYEKRSVTSLKYKDTFDEQVRLIKCLSLMQVTFRSRKYKKWLQDILSWFSDKNRFYIEKENYQNFLDNWLLEYFKENIPVITLDNPYNEGTRTPHFLFNFIDYLYWVYSVEHPDKYLFDFDFKYRNSVEHHLPQSFRNERNTEWIDNLGNICLVSKSSNSKMNNEDPKGKASPTGKYYKKDLPPKQKIMYDSTNGNYNWDIGEIEKHYKEVVTLLTNVNTILFLGK